MHTCVGEFLQIRTTAIATAIGISFMAQDDEGWPIELEINNQ